MLSRVKDRLLLLLTGFRWWRRCERCGTRLPGRRRHPRFDIYHLSVHHEWPEDHGRGFRYTCEACVERIEQINRERASWLARTKKKTSRYFASWLPKAPLWPRESLPTSRRNGGDDFAEKLSLNAAVEEFTLASLPVSARFSVNDVGMPESYDNCVTLIAPTDGPPGFASRYSWKGSVYRLRNNKILIHWHSSRWYED